MYISVVLPIYNERENLTPLIDELESVLSTMGGEYEIIAVDDGSRDGSVELLKRLVTERPCLKALLFRRNAGQSAASMLGSGQRPARSWSPWTPIARTIHGISPR